MSILRHLFRSTLWMLLLPIGVFAGSADGRAQNAAPPATVPLIEAYNGALGDVLNDPDLFICLRQVDSILHIPISAYELHVSETVREALDRGLWRSAFRLPELRFLDRSDLQSQSEVMQSYQPSLLAGSANHIDLARRYRELFDVGAVVFQTIRRNRPNLVEITVTVAAFRPDGSICQSIPSDTVYYDLGENNALATAPNRLGGDLDFVDLKSALRRSFVLAIEKLRSEGELNGRLRFATQSEFEGRDCDAFNLKLNAIASQAASEASNDQDVSFLTTVAEANFSGWERIGSVNSVPESDVKPVLSIKLLNVGRAAEAGPGTLVGQLSVILHSRSSRTNVLRGDYFVPLDAGNGRCETRLTYSLEKVLAQMKRTPRYDVKLSPEHGLFRIGELLELTMEIPSPGSLRYSKIFPYCWILSDDEGMILYPNASDASRHGFSPGDHRFPAAFGMDEIPITDIVQASVHCFIGREPAPDELAVRWTDMAFQSIDVPTIVELLNEFRELNYISEVHSLIDVRGDT